MVAKESVRIPTFAISTAIGLEAGPATKKASGKGKSISGIMGMSQDILKIINSSKIIQVTWKRRSSANRDDDFLGAIVVIGFGVACLWRGRLLPDQRSSHAIYMQ